MDEKYIDQLYNTLGGQKKFGKYDDFKNLISTNEDYRKDFYSSIGEKQLGGYDDFNSLVSSTPAQPTQQSTGFQPVALANVTQQPEVKPINAKAMGLQPMQPSATTIPQDVLAAKQKAVQPFKNEDYFDKTIADLDPENYQDYKRSAELVGRETDPRWIKQLAESRENYKAFADKVVGRYNPETTQFDYRQPDYQPQEGDIVAGEEKKGGGLYGMGDAKFSKLEKGKWVPVTPPSPVFGLNDKMDDVTVMGYKALRVPKEIAETRRALGLERAEPNSLIKQEDYDKTVNDYFGDSPLAKEFFTYYADNDTGRGLPFLLKDEPEVRQAFKEGLNTAQITSTEGRFAMASDAIARAYHLNADPFVKEDGNAIDRGYFYKRLLELNKGNGEFNQTMDRLKSVKAALESETNPTKAAKLKEQYTAIAGEANTLQQSLIKNASFFSLPENAGVLQTMDKQEKGRKLISGLHQFFPKMTAEENEIFRKQNATNKPWLSNITDPVESLFSGAKRALLNIGQNVVGLPLMLNGQASREWESAVNSIKGTDDAFHYVQHHTDGTFGSEVKNLLNDVSHLTGAMVPTMIGGGNWSALGNRIKNGLAFGVDSYQNSVDNAKKSGVKSTTEANIYGLVNGAMMGVLGAGLMSPAQLKGFSIKPDIAMRLLSPQYRRTAERELLDEIFKYKLQKAGGVVTQAFKGAAEMQVISAVNALYHAGLNERTGSNLSTDMPTVTDFLKNTLVFGIQNIAMRSIAKGENLSDPNTQRYLTYKAASGDLANTIKFLNDSMNEPGAPVELLTEAKDKLVSFAGHQFPKSMTPAQQVLAGEKIDSINELKGSIKKGMDETIASMIDDQIKIKQKELAEITKDPEAAQKELDAVVAQTEKDLPAGLNVEPEAEQAPVAEVATTEAGKELYDRQAVLLKNFEARKSSLEAEGKGDEIESDSQAKEILEQIDESNLQLAELEAQQAVNATATDSEPAEASNKPAMAIKDFVGSKAKLNGVEGTIELSEDGAYVVTDGKREAEISGAKADPNMPVSDIEGLDIYIPENHPAAEQASIEAEPATQDITPAAKKLLKLGAGGVTDTMTPGLEQIANENGIAVNEASTPKQIISALKQKAAQFRPAVESAAPAQPAIVEPMGSPSENEPISTAEPQTEAPVRKLVPALRLTRSGLNEEQRLEAVAARVKDTTITDRQRKINQLHELVGKFKARPNGSRTIKAGTSSNEISGKLSPEGREEQAAITELSNELGVNVTSNFNVVDGKTRKKIARDYSESGDRSIVPKGKPMHERSQEVQDAYNAIADADYLLPAASRLDGKQMDAKQVKGAIADIDNGVPSARAESVLNAIEEMVRKGSFEGLDKDTRMGGLSIDQMTGKQPLSNTTDGTFDFDNLGSEFVPFAAGNEKPQTPEQKAASEKIINWMRDRFKYFADGERIIANPVEMTAKLKELAEKGKEGVRFLSTAKGEVYGFVHDGKIYLDPSSVTPEIIAEEFAHLQQAAIRAAAQSGNAEAVEIITSWDKATLPFVADHLAGKNERLEDLGIDLSADAYKQQEGESRAAYRQRIQDEVWAKAQSPEAAALLEKLASEGKLVGAARRVYDSLKEMYKYIAQKLGIEFNKSWDSLSLPGLIEKTNQALGRGEFLDTLNAGEPGNPRFAIIGRKGVEALDKAEGNTERIDNHGIAVEMDKQAIDPLIIRRATGWEKQPDGWRYEVMDELQSVEDVYLLAGKTEGFIGHRLSTFVTPELSKAYPELKDVVVDIDINRAHKQPTGRFLSGEVDGKKLPEEIMVNASNFKDAQSVLLHELQHKIQRIEGFARGGNVDMFEHDTPFEIRELMSMAKELDYTNENALSKFLRSAKNFLENSEMPEYYNEFREVVERGKDAVSQADQKIARERVEKYLRLAGEVEARNVQARVNLSEESRRETLLSETQDTAAKDKIYLDADGKPMDLPADQTDRAIKDKSRVVKLAENIDRLADAIAKPLADGAAMSDLSQLPRSVVASALKVISASMKAGDKVADAITKGINELKTYMAKVGIDYTDEIRNAFISKVVQDGTPVHKQLIKEGFLPKDWKPVKATQKAIASAVETGKVKGDTVTMTARQAFRKQILDFVRGEKFGAKSEKERQQELEATKDGIRQLINEAVDKAAAEGKLSGDGKTKTILSLVKRLNAANTPDKLLKFYDHIQKTLEDFDFERKLSDANSVRESIKKANKSKSVVKNAATKQAIADFARINPNSVENIDEYLDMAQKVLTVASGIKVITAPTGPAKVSNAVFEVATEDIAAYTEKQLAFGEQKAADRFASMFDDMVSLGILDPSNMTKEEMKELIAAINGESQQNANSAAERFANNEKKMEALRAAVEYNQMALADVDSPDMTDMQRRAVIDLQQIDLSQLSASELAKMNDVINNIIVNNDYHGAGEISKLASVQDSVDDAKQALAKSDIKLGSIGNAFVKAFASTQLLNQFIYKANKLTADMQRFSGIDAIMRGHARTKVLQDKTVNAYNEFKKGKKDIDSPVNRIRRGVFADVMNTFGGSDADIATEFNRRKSLIAQTFEKLATSKDKNEQREAAVIQQVYNELLEGSQSLADVEAKMKDLNPFNKRLVEFWQDAFDKRKELTKENAEMFNNQVWEDVENYTATRMKGFDGTTFNGSKDHIDSFDKEFVSKQISHQMAGSKNRKNRFTKLPKNSVLDLDFDNLQSRAFYETNYDVETGEAISGFKSFMKNPQADELFGSRKNKEIMLQSMRATVLQQKGKVPPLQEVDRLAETFEKQVLRRISAKGARVALGSLSQLPKQYISVALSTLTNLGADAGLYFKAFKVSNSIPLFEQYNIGQRGDTKAGYNKDIDLGEIHAANWGGDVSHAMGAIDVVGEKISNAIMSPLMKSDVSVARTSWLAYYMQDLRKQGVDIDAIDWAKEHEHPNDEAAAYAEQMTSRSQNANDSSSIGAAFKARGTGKLIGNLFLPFSGFSTNMRVRTTNDVQKLMSGNKEVMKEGALSLTATVVEQAVFNAIKVYALQAATTGLAQFVAGKFNLFDDKDKAKAENYKNPEMTVAGMKYRSDDETEKVIANTVSDLLFGGMGSGVQSVANSLTNVAWGAIADEKYANGEINEYPQLFYRQRAQSNMLSPENWGRYGVVVRKMMDVADESKEALLGKTDFYVDKDHTKTVDITQDEQNAYRLLFLMDALALVGVSDAELLQANAKLKHIADKKMESNKRYGGTDFNITSKGSKKYLKTKGN